MRTIKFRAWIPDSGMMMEGTLDFWFQASVETNTNPLRARPDSVMLQWTGLTDKNGKEIYEGDILEEDSEWWQVRYTDRAMFEAISFPRSVDFALEEIATSATVQGNIYENSELLNV